MAVERIAQAQRDRDVGLLNKVRALKEIDEIDINQIEKLMLLSQLLKQEETEIETPTIVGSSPQEPTIEGLAGMNQGDLGLSDTILKEEL